MNTVAQMLQLVQVLIYCLIPFSDANQTLLQEDVVNRLEQTQSDCPIMIGNGENFWLYTEKDGFDLTHPASPSADPLQPRIKMQTYDNPIAIMPNKTAMIVVDMLNSQLSQPSNSHNVAHDVEHVLVSRAIPVARRANIQVVYLNWGLSDYNLEIIDPSLQRMWSFSMEGMASLNKGIGHQIGQVQVENGSKVEAGRKLIRDQWNTDLHYPLEELRLASLDSTLPDELFYKNHICGMCKTEDGKDDSTLSKTSAESLHSFLRRRGITTLLFTGVNSDFCVLATMAAANLKGYDTILLKDATDTTNGEAPRLTALLSSRSGWGFLSSVEELEKGTECMKLGIDRRVKRGGVQI